MSEPMPRKPIAQATDDRSRQDSNRQTTMKRPNASLVVRLSLLLTSLGLGGCLNPGPPLEVRTFEPAFAPRVASTARVRQPLVFDGARARSHLDLSMVWRVSDVELQVEAQNRWIAAPEELVGERMRTALFESGPFAPGSTGDARLSLDIDAFEGIRDDRARAFVALTASLWDPDGQTRIRRVEAASMLTEASGEGLARGIGAALDQCIEELLIWLEE